MHICKIAGLKYVRRDLLSLWLFEIFMNGKEISNFRKRAGTQVTQRVVLTGNENSDLVCK